MVSKVVNVGDPKGLYGHTTNAKQGLCCEHDPHHGQMFGFCASGTAVIGQAGGWSHSCGQAQRCFKVL